MNAETLKKLEEKIEPILENLGFELVDRQFVNEQGGFVLRIFIDKPGGINLDDCKNVSHSIEDIIEVENFISKAYRLEVSSPGWDRPLRKPNDFEKFKGNEIKLESAKPIDGRRRWRGILNGLIDNNIVMMVDGKEYRIPHDAISKAKIIPNEKDWQK